MALGFIAAAAGLLGLAIGSFLGVLVLRLPEGRPVAMARSQCPHCGRVLSASELVPLISWLAQRRRCRGCGARLSAFYPAMEIAGAAIAVAAVVSMPWPQSVAICIGGWVVLALAALALTRLSC